LPSENIIKIDKISQDVFKDDNKFIIINSGMGSGKTAQTIDKLKKLKQDENRKGFLVVSKSKKTNSLIRQDN
jgi:ribose 5-phosphate isomerase